MNSQKRPADYSLKVPQTPSISEKLPLSRFSPAPVNLLKRSKLPLNSPNSLKLLEFPQNSSNSLETPQTPSKLPELPKTPQIPSKHPKISQNSPNRLRTLQTVSKDPKLSRIYSTILGTKEGSKLLMLLPISAMVFRVRG